MDLLGMGNRMVPGIGTVSCDTGCAVVLALLYHIYGCESRFYTIWGLVYYTTLNGTTSSGDGIDIGTQIDIVI